MLYYKKCTNPLFCIKNTEKYSAGCWEEKSLLDIIKNMIDHKESFDDNLYFYCASIYFY